MLGPQQRLAIKAPQGKVNCSRTESYPNGNFGNLFLEYKSESEPKGECYATVDGTSYTILTWGQKIKNQSPSHALGTNPTFSSNDIHIDQGA